MNLRRTLLCALLAASFPAVLGAGTVITVKEFARKNSTDQLYLQKGDLRMEASEAGRVMIYRKDGDTFLMLNPADKTYVDVGATQSADAGKSKPGGRPADSPVAYRKVGSGVKMNGFVTDQYEVIQGEEKIAEVWMADPKTLDIDPADVAGFRLLAKRMGYRAPSYFGFALGENGPEGVPVRTVAYYAGQRVSINEFEGIHRQDLPASMFELPQDYKPGSFKGPGGN